MSLDVFCIDIEASGLDPASYPIEIALVDVMTSEVRSWLIRPTERWLGLGVWQTSAEALHGLSLDRLMIEGLPVEIVAEQLTRTVQGRCVLSDHLDSDRKWLHDLYHAVGIATLPFLLQNFYVFAKQVASAAGRRFEVAFTKVEAEAWQRFPIPHRAEPDAKRNAEMLRYLEGCWVV